MEGKFKMERIISFEASGIAGSVNKENIIPILTTAGGFSSRVKIKKICVDRYTFIAATGDFILPVARVFVSANVVALFPDIDNKLVKGAGVSTGQNATAYMLSAQQNEVNDIGSIVNTSDGFGIEVAVYNTVNFAVADQHNVFVKIYFENL